MCIYRKIMTFRASLMLLLTHCHVQAYLALAMLGPSSCLAPSSSGACKVGRSLLRLIKIIIIIIKASGLL